MLEVEPKEFLRNPYPVLDIRSPAEFDQGHIHGALSFPLFSNEERALVGTSYKQESREEAIKKGLSIVGPKMVSFIEAAEKLDSKSLSLYCWRGGMRSGSMGWLLEQYGFDIYLLKGGYKAFRGYAHEVFSSKMKLRILTGLTGSGKTDVLKEMKQIGAQVIDLEALANHPGSSFGNHLKQLQPTTEMFQNMIFEELVQLDLTKPIWLEDESICIGQVHLPEVFWEQMLKSARCLLEVPKEVRQKTLVAQYQHMGVSNLINATREISKKLGGQEADMAEALIKEGDLFTASGILLSYYDRQYKKGIKKLEETVAEVVKVDAHTPSETAHLILRKYGN